MRPLSHLRAGAAAAPSDLRGSRRPSRLLRLLVGNAILGAFLGWGLLAAILLTDAAGLRTLIANDLQATQVVVMLALQFGAGFATLAMATAVMLLAQEPKAIGKDERRAPARAPRIGG